MKTLTWKDIHLKPHKETAHKGDNGRVLIIGGSENYVGCLVFAGLAALRSGVDVVTVAAPERVAWAINCLTPDLITRKFSGKYFTLKHARDIFKLAEKNDVVLIGNGIGRKQQTKNFVKKIISYLNKIKKPFVIDADALSMIRIQDLENGILTPHHGEFGVLLKNSKLTENNFRKFLNNTIIVLKGHIDYVYAKNKKVANKTGHKRMTVAGTGDILAGLCAGFLAQRQTLWESACYATFFSGKLGEHEQKKRPDHYLASDLLTDIKEVVHG
ncbi:NAD(P)H-hydrate dehydratase [Candidatus Woesearchaeota archaeon]|nr:NAD(P)H-hydrate dehydratase [Candidatus Woesearchaeota archaeon]